MTVRTDAQLTTEAQTIRDETALAANTATRVGTMLIDLIDSKPNVSAVPTGNVTVNWGEYSAAEAELRVEGTAVTLMADDPVNGEVVLTLDRLAILDEGVAVTPRKEVNFVGAGVTVTDDAVNVRTVVTIPLAASDATPAAVGTATAGTSATASRSDHVHTQASDTIVTTGTFTPGIVGAGTPGTQTYAANAGYYTKRGKLVHVRAEITLTANGGGAGDAQITLPFESAAGTKQALTISYISNVTMSGDFDFFSMKIDASASVCKLKENKSAGSSGTVAITAFAATASIAFSGTYEAAS